MDNIFAGNITLKKGSIDVSKYDFDIIASGEKTYFVMWEVDEDNLTALVQFFTETFNSDIESYDLSISSVDQIDVLADKYTEGVYEVVSFEWADISFDTISERFELVDEVCIVREAEQSEKYGNRIVKVDFLY